MSSARARAKGLPSVAPNLADQMDAQVESAAELLRVMASPQRLRVLCLLLEGERSVGQINEQVGLSQSALSQHLAVLREGNLVATRRQAQTVFYSVATGAVHDIIQTLHSIFCKQPHAERLRNQTYRTRP
jgi:ArsR family transcriptional regulator, virulence genes transcriptional regulator